MTATKRLCCTLSLVCAAAAAPPADVEQRIDQLLSRMTLDEKIGQMSQGTSLGSPVSERSRQQIREGYWGSFLNTAKFEDRAEAQRIVLKESRLGIPLIFGRDVIHGYRTVLPIPLAQAATWDPDLVEQGARMAAREASSVGIHWTFAPMIDVARDPRWGRIAEGPGEDPYLASALAAAMVRGFQGPSLDAPGSIAACAKHYVGYGAVEGGRDYNSAWIPEILLRDVYLPPFQAARDAGVATFMSAFQDLNGVPATGNEFTLRQVLRGEWKFDGFVVSDYASVGEMVMHGYAADHAEAALKGVRAGVDMEMGTNDYHEHLKALVEAGKLDVKLIDEAVRNILRVKFRMGLFDKPVPTAADPAALLAPESLEVARRLAVESAVLLKNDAGANAAGPNAAGANDRRALPLSKSIGKVAVIGPLADSPADQMGCWTIDGRRPEVRTFLAALRERLGDARVVYAPGLKAARDTSRDGFPAAVEAARAADAVLLFIGEDWNMDGEARSRAYLDLPGAQEALAEEVVKAGKPVIAVMVAGRPLTFHDVAAKVSAVLYAWNPGTMGGPALADLLFGDAVPSGKLTASFPRTVGQVPLYYAHLNTGRPASPKDLGIPPGTPVNPRGFVSKYIDVDFTPEYPFGFGLSYTTFEYSNLRLSAPAIPMGGKLTVTADVANTGKVEAEEVVQLYTRDLAASVSRPVRELKGFRRVRLKPGEKKSVEFTIGTADLAFHNARMQLVTEPGAFQVWIAPDSDRGLRGEFTVAE
jgi:beta-glucosidase